MTHKISHPHTTQRTHFKYAPANNAHTRVHASLLATEKRSSDCALAAHILWPSRGERRNKTKCIYKPVVIWTTNSTQLSRVKHRACATLDCIVFALHVTIVYGTFCLRDICIFVRSTTDSLSTRNCSEAALRCIRKQNHIAYSLTPL